MMSDLERYKDLFDELPWGLILLKGGKVVYANRAIGHLLRREEQVLEGEDFVQLFHRDDQNELQKALHRASEGAPPEGSRVFRMIRSDKASLSVELEPTPVKRNGRWDILIFIRDAGDYHRTNERLRQVQKLEALGQLSAGIVHDLNNVLGAMANYAKLLGAYVKENDEATGCLEEIEGLVERGTALARQILAASSSRDEQRAVHDLHKVLGDVVRMLRHTLPKRINIEIHEEQLPPFCMNATQVQQVIMNLCMNAADALPTGGDIKIRVQRGRVSSEKVGGLAQMPVASFVKIDVSDSGGGIEPAVLERIFEPFFSTKTGMDRSGLGLSICDKIVRAHGGLIHVESQPGEGTTFSVYLPLLEGPELRVEVKPSRVRGGKETLLLVDDERTMLQSTASLLRGLGYRTITANGGPEALALFKKNPADFQLILLDQGMPVIDGVETFRRLREIHPGVRVLLLTGLPQSEESQRALDGGILGVVQKPFRLEDLSEQIRDALDRDSPASSPP
jgi:two-component system cell cycle sensor histidine kinase/response regulator CckA